MDPKSELLVFNKKEIIVIIVLLILVALFSFTLGLKLGKSLGPAKTEQISEQAPLDKKTPADALQHHADEHADGVTGDAAGNGHDGEHQAADEHPADQKAKETANKQAIQEEAEDLADTEFSTAIKTEDVKPEKSVPMSLPVQKKGESSGGPRYTLQVGSYRTVAEAAEQVGALKRSGLDAFYVEAKLGGKGTWYRVGIGVFSSKEEAEKTATTWKKSKKALPPFIVQKVEE